MHAKNDKIYPSFVWKNDSTRKNQVCLLKISNRERWYYIEVKNYQHH